MNGRFEYPGHLIAAAVCSSSISCFSHHHQTDRIPAAAAGQLHKKCLRPDSSCLTSEYSRQFLSSCPSGFRVGEGLPDSSRRAGRRQLILPFTSRAPAHHNPGKSAARIGSIFVLFSSSEESFSKSWLFYDFYGSFYNSSFGFSEIFPEIPRNMDFSSHNVKMNHNPLMLFLQLLI